jgi:hypothetical protein
MRRRRRTKRKRTEEDECVRVLGGCWYDIDRLCPPHLTVQPLVLMRVITRFSHPGWVGRSTLRAGEIWFRRHPTQLVGL